MTGTVKPVVIVATPWQQLPQPSTMVSVPVPAPSDHAVKRRAERALNPVERRRFRALWADARRDPGCGVRPAMRIALARMKAELVERIERAEKIARNYG